MRFKKNIIKAFVVFVFFYSSVLYCGWKEQKESLEKVVFINEFRIFYSLSGKHELPEKHKIDNNKNGIPDYVDDIGLQLKTSAELFLHLGFVHPLRNSRYKSQNVEAIDVHILSSKTGGGAGDAIISFKYDVLDDLFPKKALAINLSVNLKYHSLTPQHELFHLFQNGYTMFKNSWYEEGMARWAEWILRQSHPKQTTLPQNIDELEMLVTKSYGAYSFWARAAALCDNHNGQFKFTQINNNYVDGEFIIEDNKIFGVNFIIKFLENLETKDKKVSYIKGYSIYRWKEKDQRDIYNIPFMLCSIKETLLSQCESYNKEISKFINVIDEYTNMKCTY